MSLDREQFADFFAAVRPGQKPFSWQERLLDLLVSQGRWPDRIVAPTGAGKTAVVDVHVFANALAAAGRAPRLPRRLVLVVDRRAVVDSHDDHARVIARLLDGAGGGVLAEVAKLLVALRLDLGKLDVPGLFVDADEEPLLTARFRGGAPPPRSWRDVPEACAVITGTPDMIGSRLLLQGYGSSRGAWPREAGLLAHDCALVVDEAHLSRQFLATARRVSELAGSEVIGAVPVLQVVETTATPQQGDGIEVGVEDGDLSDQVLNRRMRADKPVEVLRVPRWPVTADGPAVLAVLQQVRRAHADLGPTVGCVVNRVATAAALARLLRADGLTVELLVGRMRPADVTHLRRRRPGLLDISGDPEVDVLVATQTIEVGVDLDLSALVTELAPGAALAQRSGRVNRRGQRDNSRVVVAVPDADVPEKGSAPYDRDDLVRSLAWLTRRAHDPAGLSPWAVRDDAPPGQALRRRLLRRLELTDSWAWAATGEPRFAAPDLDLWLADDLSADRDVGLVCRADLPSDSLRALELLRLLPPRAHEVFPVPIGLMAAVLPTLANRRAVLRWRSGEVEELTPGTAVVRPGDVIVVDAEVPFQQVGVVGSGDDVEPAMDVLEHVSDPTSAVRAGSVVLRWGEYRKGASLLGPLPTSVVDLLRDGPAGAMGGWSRSQRRELVDLLQGAKPRIGLDAAQEHDLLAMRDATVALLRNGRVKDSAIDLLTDDQAAPVVLVLRDLRRAAADEDLRQTWTPNEFAVSLDQHANAVARAAAALAVRLGLDKEPVEQLRLAGLHHDDGKADPRFQRVLGQQPGGSILAKGAARKPVSDAADRTAAGLPTGWRHEQLSALLAWRAIEPRLRDLVTRLVGTTHGRGRPSFPHGARSLLGTLHHEQLPDAVTLFDEGTWEQLVSDTDESLGVWTVAYLEALLRAADGRVSAAGS